jgi:hypothetical protein
MRIEGVAYIPEPDEYPQTWEVPDGPIPVRVEFNATRDPIGTATLTKHPDGTITATAEIIDGRFLTSFPKFAVGVALRKTGDGATLDGGSVYSVSVCRENRNTDILPYTIAEDE